MEETQLTSFGSSWIYEIAGGGQTFGVLLLFPVCSYCVQSTLDRSAELFYLTSVALK